MNSDSKIKNSSSNVKPKHAISGDIDDEQLTEAISLAELGFHIFPCHGIKNEVYQYKDGAQCLDAGKKPHLSGYQKLASSDPEKIRQWSSQFPGCNFGVLTGNGTLVLDVDIKPDRNGEESLENLILEHGPLPDTWTVLTGGGGMHYWFTYPQDLKIRNSGDKLGKGLDIRAAGGYVIGPGSNHISGKKYEWEASSNPDVIPIAPAPSWLLERLTTTQKTTVQRKDSAYLPMTIPEGTRHDSLFREGIYYRHLWMSPDRVRFILQSLNSQRCVPPLEPDDLEEKVIKQVLKAKPRPTRKPGLSEDTQKILSWFKEQPHPGHPITVAKHVISAATGVSIRNIPRCIKALFEHGVIELEETKGKPNTYKLISTSPTLTHAKGMLGVYLPSSSYAQLFPEGAVSHYLLSGGENGHSHVLTTGIRSIPTQFNGN
jgi:hypothetical protein